MRLDKYLKVSRLIKRRSVANDACDADRILVNGIYRFITVKTFEKQSALLQTEIGYAMLC